MNTRAVIAVFLGSLLLLAGCSAGASGTAGVTVGDAWARPAAAGDQPGAAYLTITNGGGQADTLLGVTSPVAGSIEMHETSMDSSGMMGMHPVERIDVPSGGVVKLEPGGYHLMLVGLTRELRVGDTVELDLTFEHAGKVTVTADVRQG